MRKETKLEIISAVILAIVMLIGIVVLLFVLRDSLAEERLQQERIRQSLNEAREVEKQRFCESYRSYTKPEDSPYAYKHCFTSPKTD